MYPLGKEEGVYLLLLVLAAVQVLILGLILHLYLKLGKMGKRIRVGSRSGAVSVGENLEPVLMRLEGMAKDVEKVNEALERLQGKVERMSGWIGFQRYDAFTQGQTGFSFSLALINEQGDGVVLTSIYNRGNSHLYAKPLHRHRSPIPLSGEEEEVVRQARGGPGRKTEG